MRWKCTVSYDGTPFCGWQSQANGQSVQDALEARLKAIFHRNVRIHGSGRTDAGVHARGQVFHFDADWKHETVCLLRAINRELPIEIQVTNVEPVPDTFHARFSACSKRYHYYFQLHPASPFEARYVWAMLSTIKIDIRRMQEAAKLLVGTHDFRGFAGKVLPKEHLIKTITAAQIFPQGNQFVFSISGSGYLYRMVRRIMGAFFWIGCGKWEVDFIQQRLQLQNLSIPILTAPACGLFLEEVRYKC